MSERLNDIFGMAVHFAAILLIVSGFLTFFKKKPKLTGILMIFLGFFILLLFRTIIGDNIVPVG